jgi:hypothetical protein
MSDLEKIELAARRTRSAIQLSEWIDEGTRKFMANVFEAFADEIAKIIRIHEDEP